MAQFGSDTFTGADGATVRTSAMTTGGTWTLHPSFTSGATYDIEYKTNRARASNNTQVLYQSSAASSANYTVQIDVVTQSGGSSAILGVAGRISTAAITFYWADYYDDPTAGSRTWRLFKYLGGAATSLGSYTQNLGASATATLKLEMLGTAIKAYVDGVERISATDSSITAAGYAGIIAGNALVPTTNSVFGDNYSADAAPAGCSAFRRRPSGLYVR